MTDRIPNSPYSKEAVLKREAEEAARCHASSNRVPTRGRLAEIAACVISGELDWGVPSMEDTDPWEIADLILKELGRAIPKRAADGVTEILRSHAESHTSPNRVYSRTELARILLRNRDKGIEHTLNLICAYLDERNAP